LCGFIGEVFVVLSVWKFSTTLAVISAAVVILTAAYILWVIQRVYLGAEYKGPHEEALVPMNLREVSIAIPLVVLAILFGVFPGILLQYMDPTIDRQVQELVAWQKREKPAELGSTQSDRSPNDTAVSVGVSSPEQHPDLDMTDQQLSLFERSSPDHQVVSESP
jgi:NADH-quinone oxidoreductase subunit M